MNLRNAILRVALVSFAAVSVSASHACAEVAAGMPSASDPAYVAMLGSAASTEIAQRLGVTLRVPAQPGDPEGSVRPFFSALQDKGSPGSPRFEASGIALDLHYDQYPALRIENAKVALVPSADGRTCRFELSGAPFGPTSKLDATGTIEWKAGPAGGHKLDVEFRLDDASVEAIRTWAPTRMDPAFSGILGVRGRAGGVVGEVTTEEMPATPLKGDIEATLDMTALGKTAPLTIKTQFALDDRMARLTNGRMSWLEEAVTLKGWLKPEADGDFELIAGFANVDTAAVATRWNVAPPWRMASTLSGAVTMKGKPGKGLIRYEAKAPLITAPGLGGYDIRIEDATLIGSLLAINAEIAVSVRAKRTLIGGIDLGPLPVGIRWWENKLHVNNSNSKLFGGDNEGSFLYEPSKHPAFSFHGRIRNGETPVMLKNLAPWLAFDVDGSGSIAFVTGQDEAGAPLFAFHGSLTQGRIGGADLFGATLAALAKADPALELPAGTVPAPRKGTGTRVDRWFFEGERKNDVYGIGGLFLMAGDFRLDGDGQFTREAGLTLEGTVSLPVDVATKLAAAAPWAASLKRGDAMFVPVTVSGPLTSLQVALAPGYAELVAKAKRGEPVDAPGAREVRHVGPDNLAPIPVDPANEQLQ